MSTRSTTKFGYGPPVDVLHSTANTPTAIVYRHYDGYLSSMLPALKEFFGTVEKETKDTRFTDPSYLASKWLVFLAREFSTPTVMDGNGQYSKDTDSPKSGSLDFLGLGIVAQDPDDIEYSYWLDCSPQTSGKRPAVYVKSGYGENWSRWVKVGPRLTAKRTANLLQGDYNETRV